jgi:hypothetical protein
MRKVVRYRIIVAAALVAAPAAARCRSLHAEKTG